MTTWRLWVNVVLGLWISLSSYLGLISGGGSTNLTLIGVVIVSLSLWEIFRPTHQAGWHSHGHA